MLLVGVAQAQAPSNIERAEPYVYEQYVPDWKALMTKNMLRVAECESGLKTDAEGDFGQSFGVLQIHLPSHPEVTKEQAFDPFFSVQWAYEKNPQIWTCGKKLQIYSWN